MPFFAQDHLSRRAPCQILIRVEAINLIFLTIESSSTLVFIFLYFFNLKLIILSEKFPKSSIKHFGIKLDNFRNTFLHWRNRRNKNDKHLYKDVVKDSEKVYLDLFLFFCILVKKLKAQKSELEKTFFESKFLHDKDDKTLVSVLKFFRSFWPLIWVKFCRKKVSRFAGTKMATR